jgi:(p)ppGpp synthase/HD superfamily hydrolase
MELVIDNRKIFEDSEAERAEKMTSLCSDSGYSEKQFINTLNLFNRKKSDIAKALEYAKGLDFSNNHLKSSYLSHPLRLASYLVKMDPSIGSDYIAIALLHNVPETTKITIEEIKNIFGANIASGIQLLVVDRTVPFLSIQDAYYENIFSKGNSLVLVKLLDKIDNLFVLGLNPDDEVRRNYIIEVREKLLPFAYRFNPRLGQYLDDLLKTTSDLGFTEKLKKRLLAYQQSL